MKDKMLKFIHSKNFIITLIILLMILIIATGTYAWFTWSSSDNTSFTMTIGKLADVTFNSGNDISTDKLAPVFNYTDGEKTTFSINNRDTSGTNFNYSVKLNITSIASELRVNSFKYVLLKGDTKVAEGNLVGTSDGSSVKIYNGSLGTGITNFTFYLYIDSNMENDVNIIGKSFTGALTVEESSNLALETLTKLNALNSSIAVDTTHVPDFSTVSGNNGTAYSKQGDVGGVNQGDSTKGIYSTEDDFGTTYYFRGTVENNYVKFGGFYWRIIRINGDGSVRMIYAGDKAYANGNTSADPVIGVVGYNSNNNDNTYAGYMTGTVGSSTYTDTHSNTSDSKIKAYIDEWYTTNLKNYESYLEDTIYCNDRKVVAAISNAIGDGSGVTVSTYVGYTRIHTTSIPTLKCENKNDRFTVSNTMGNTKLTNPIALITSDELVYAGATGFGSNYVTNNEFYLYSNSPYWTMTPYYFMGGNIYVDYFNQDGYIDYDHVNRNTRGVRPVISLKSNAINGGTGTMSDPFVVS